MEHVKEQRQQTGKSTVYSVCGMCGVRCPIAVEVERGRARAIFGNPHSALQGALCARGAAGIALEESQERPTSPLIRTGQRGAGQWKAVSWDEALDYVAKRLLDNARTHGPESLLWSDREGPFTDLPRAFMRGMGSPNVCTHGVTCDLNVHHATKAVTGMGRGMVVHDYARCRHLVLQGRNLFESINVAETLAVSKARKNGCRLTVLDVRPTVTAAKADRYFGLRPGSDYAFNLAVIHVLIHEGLYNKDFVARHATGLETLTEFTRSHTPEWAEAETGVSAASLREFVRELAAAAPHILWHPGWMTTRYQQSFQTSRTAHIINALLGSTGAQGGLLFASSPADVGRKGLRKFVDLYPAPSVPRVDGAGSSLPSFDPAKGLLHRCFAAMHSAQPYAIKSYIAWRHDPLQALPDPEAMKKLFSHLDLLVSVTFSWSDTAWHSDVVLPLSPYLSRESIIATKSGLKPQFFVRQRAVQPSGDTRADWEILAGLAQRLGLDKLAFDSAEELWSYQLQDTGVSIDDFATKGFVELSDAPRFPDMDSFRFPTPTGKLDLAGEHWHTASGATGLDPYRSPSSPPQGAFRVVFGRVAVHTQGHTVNNPLLFEQMPTNVACIHPSRAAALGLAQGVMVEVLDSHGHSAGTLPLHITEGIHPEALFLVHGFGHRLPCESLAQGQGVGDQELMPGGLNMEDSGGGGLTLQEHFVTLREVRA